MIEIKKSKGSKATLVAETKEELIQLLVTSMAKTNHRYVQGFASFNYDTQTDTITFNVRSGWRGYLTLLLKEDNTVIEALQLNPHIQHYATVELLDQLDKVIYYANTIDLPTKYIKPNRTTLNVRLDNYYNQRFAKADDLIQRHIKDIDDLIKQHEAMLAALIAYRSSGDVNRVVGVDNNHADGHQLQLNYKLNKGNKDGK